MLMKRRTVIACAAGVLAAPAWAQFRVEISGVGATQLPISIVKFRDEDRAGQAISTIVRDDLERSGVFRIVEGGGALDETSQPNWAEWRGRGSDALAAGSTTRLADGRWEAWLDATPGLYRVNLRLDDGPWLAPPGMPSVDDDFGGRVGLLAL